MEAVIDQGWWYSLDPKTAWVLNQLTAALLGDTSHGYTDQVVAHLLAACVPGGQVIEDKSPDGVDEQDTASP